MSQSTQFLGPVVPLAMFVVDISEIGTKKIDFKTINVGRHKKWRKKTITNQTFGTWIGMSGRQCKVS